MSIITQPELINPIEGLKDLYGTKDDMEFLGKIGSDDIWD
jgi:hypothetical protein